jgi:hypothetical protein
MGMCFLGFEKLGRKGGWQAWEGTHPKAAGDAYCEILMQSAHVLARSVIWFCGGLGGRRPVVFERIDWDAGGRRFFRV